MKIKKIFFAILLVTFSLNSFSENSLVKTKENNDVTFFYNWESTEGNNELAFRLPIESIQSSYFDFKGTSPEEINDYTYKYVRSKLAYTGPFAKDIVLVKKENQIQMQLMGDHTINEIRSISRFFNNTVKQGREEYLSQKYLILKDQWLTIDYEKVANTYKPKMKDIAVAFRERNVNRTSDIRAVLNDVLSFYQAIPYDKLESRLVGDNEFGFSTPLKLLYQNRGDCDTKLVAYAATIKNLYNVKTIAVVVPEHIFIGFKIPVQSGDNYIVFEGQNYVLAETAGPGIIPIGEVADSSYNYVKTNNYKIYNL